MNVEYEIKQEDHWDMVAGAFALGVIVGALGVTAILFVLVVL